MVGQPTRMLKSHDEARQTEYAHLPTSFERFRCEVNRKKSKFECYGLLATVDIAVRLK
jgi:hypothetical protein